MNEKWNNGKDLEILVQIIEKGISPDSIVEHDVYLPVLSSKNGATRQCDIVIRNGKIPRETLTIVEVQDRRRAVNINDFGGWMQKLNQVGAQHLICVSRQEFPESIKEQAALSGNTIKLITLIESSPAEVPVDLFKFGFEFHDTDILNIHKEEVIYPPFDEEKLGLTVKDIDDELLTLKSNDYKFLVNRKELKALSTLCIEKTPTDHDVVESKSTIELGHSLDSSLHLRVKEVFVQVKMRLTYTWSHKTVFIHPTIMSYKQNEHGILAWVIEALYMSRRGLVSFKVPAVKREDGIVVDGILVSAPFDGSFTLKLER